MNREEALRREATWARPAALAAFFAAVLLLAHIVLPQTIVEERPGTEPYPNYLLSVDENPGTLLASNIAQAVATLLVAGVFLYLFRAIQAREGGIPNWFVYLIVIGPALYAISVVITGFAQIDAASQFAEGAPIRGQAGEDRAEDIIQDQLGAGVFAINFAGQVATAFLFVMLPLRARRVGLLSPFMGILGVVAGALIVLQILGGVSVIIEAFWLAAIGSLFLDNWPGGRGPAWRSGRPEPWPSPARRGAEPPSDANGRGGSLLEPSEQPEPEPVPDRPSSRKRRRNR